MCTIVPGRNNKTFKDRIAVSKCLHFLEPVSLGYEVNKQSRFISRWGTLLASEVETTLFYTVFAWIQDPHSIVTEGV